MKDMMGPPQCLKMALSAKADYKVDELRGEYYAVNKSKY